MQPDSATRALLALILLCLTVLVVRDLRRDGSSDGAHAPGWGRYQVTGMRAGAPVLIRTDTVTGQVWKLELRGGGNRWRPFLEPEAAGEASAATGSARATEREIVEPPGGLEAARAELEAARPTLESLGLSRPPQQQRPLKPEEVEVFLQALTQTELPSDMRAWAAGQLASVDTPETLQALILATEDDDAAVAAAAAEALGQRSDPAARRALEAATAHADPTVREAAGRALDETP